MKNILTFKTSVFILMLLAFAGNKALAQERIQLPDSTVLIALDTLRVVYIHADTGKALNRVDKLGHKQGLWEQKYSNGNIRYRGHFRDDKPVGVFKYFYEFDDSLRILAIYSDNGKVSRVHEYYENGAMASTGKYIDQKKDSVWKLYDEIQNVRGKEQYVNGQKEGKSITFYPDGNILETKMWHNGLENGKWEQYYDDDTTIKLEGNYVNGKLEGPASFYNENGGLEIQGSYTNDMKSGKWTYYSHEGSRKDTISFINGRPINPKRLILTQQQLDSMKNNNQNEEENRPKNIGEDQGEEDGN